jgi:hypothetical protein
MSKAVLWIPLMAAAMCCGTALAQQEKGDKEVGIGGQAFFTHNSNFGSLAIEGSLGYFVSVRNYVGLEVEPSLVFARLNGVRTTAGEVFIKGTYRRLIGKPTGKVFPFFGGGGGLEELEKQFGSAATAAGFTQNGLLFAEVGFKSYLSQRTSLEFAYTLNFIPADGGGFRNRTFSQAVISVRKLF